MRSLSHDLAESMRAPEFWALSSWLDIVVRYRQSRLGIFWLVAPAIVYIWGLGAFFAAMMGVSVTRFAAHVAIGYVVYRLVSSAIVESTTAFSSAGAFIQDGHMRLTDFVLRVLAKALFYFVMSLPVVAVALAIYPDIHWSGFAYALASFPLVILNALWVGILFALVGARFPDLSQFIGNVFMFAFLLTPIIWQADSMPADSLRGLLMRFNPLFHMVEVVRAPILGEQLEGLTLYYLGAMTLLGWAAAIFAYRRYARFVPIWI
ncbi:MULTISPECIES: ABC transporter permease [unclassified Lysobacter]|uniref:ABC transporter permease n=1 Tax=unclassified Lysobacter TaxID=2635362 RepID=UPI001F56D39E|nr:MULTISPECIES: ABC transporter permease [unclassified Lysobacter]